MPISSFPSVKTSRRAKRTSIRNRSKDWAKSWEEYRTKLQKIKTIDVYIPPSSLEVWRD